MEKYHEEKLEYMKTFLSSIANVSKNYIAGHIPAKIIDNAINRFGDDLDRETILGFLDTTFTNNGKNGYIFTDDKIYYQEPFGKPNKLIYGDIKNIEMVKTEKKDRDRVTCHI